MPRRGRRRPAAPAAGAAEPGVQRRQVHRRGQRVGCACARDGARLVFEVADTGVGMSDDEAARVFERLRAGRRLGHAAPRRLRPGPDDHAQPGGADGRHDAGRKPRGARLDVHACGCRWCARRETTPLIEAAASRADRPRTAATARWTACASWSSRTTRSTGWSSTACSSWRAPAPRWPATATRRSRAWPSAGAPRYDIALLDVEMPGIDGYETARRLHELDASLPLLGQTARAMAEDLEAMPARRHARPGGQAGRARGAGAPGPRAPDARRA